MQIANCKLQIVGLACVFALAADCSAKAEPFSFDDIQFWVGSGANRAALVIDWVENSTQTPALAWGYRWDGTARGRDMLVAIIAADPRLLAKLGGTRADPNAVYGVGYDANNDGEFGIDDGTAFDSEGFAFSGPADGALATDSEDYYAEGWFAGFWHYGVASSNPYGVGTWSDIPVGMAGRTLTDGAWDSWTFSPSFNFASFAANPTAAMPPAAMPGDFNNDTRVDIEDYTVWRSSFGSISQLAADANGDLIVDAADYVVWRKYLATSVGSGGAPVSVPEPATVCLCLLPLLLSGRFTFRKRKDCF